MIRLVVAPLNYSSWSVRAWLALDHAGAEFKTHEIALFVDPNWRNKVLQFSGAGKVPILIDGNLSIHEALAIAEYTAERFPKAQLWPDDPQLRARARAVSSEMSTSFLNVRNEMPMNYRGRASQCSPSAEASAEIDRILDIWNASLSTSPGPFLFGEFSIADCMYVPVLSRFRTYGLPMHGQVAAWEERIWQQRSVAKWTKLAEQSIAIPKYDVLL
ncbi:MAG: glutathione S-transferase [Myxococcales bacterium]|nr:glutathione S-transferase [Myxococcales bacterium]